VAPFPDSATLLGLTLQAAASGAPPQVKEMLPLKPGIASSAYCAVCPVVPRLPSKRSTPMAKVEKALRRFPLVPPSAAILRHHQ
jgi:hypothetical protein